MSDKYQVAAKRIDDLVERYDIDKTDPETSCLSQVVAILREAFPEPTPAPEGQQEERPEADSGAWWWIRKIRARNANHKNSWWWSNKEAARRLDEYFRQLLAAHPTPEPRKEPERIVASAIQLDGVIYTGLRHHQIIGYLADAGFPTPIKGEQGFIDDTGRFLSRKDAAALALKSGQVIKLIAPGMGLDSADVFPRKAPTEPEDAQGERELLERAYEAGVQQGKWLAVYTGPIVAKDPPPHMDKVIDSLLTNSPQPKNAQVKTSLRVVVERINESVHYDKTIPQFACWQIDMDKAASEIISLINTHLVAERERADREIMEYRRVIQNWHTSHNNQRARADAAEQRVRELEAKYGA